MLQVRLFGHALKCCAEMREHLYSVYIMASLSGVLYIGVTSDLQTRVRQHKAGSFKGFPTSIDAIVWFTTNATTTFRPRSDVRSC